MMVVTWFWCLCWGWRVEKFNVFTNFLLGATIQDGGMRERSNLTTIQYTLQSNNNNDYKYL